MNQQFLETEAVKKLLERYFDAVYRADVDELKAIFHPEASMNGFLGDTMLVGSPEPFFADLSSKPSMAQEKTDCRAVITSIRVTGGVAEATLFVDNFFGAACIEDHFHLLKADGQWRILCKTFTTL